MTSLFYINPAHYFCLNRILHLAYEYIQPFLGLLFFDSDKSGYKTALNAQVRWILLQNFKQAYNHRVLCFVTHSDCWRF